MKKEIQPIYFKLKKAKQKKSLQTNQKKNKYNLMNNDELNFSTMQNKMNSNNNSTIIFSIIIAIIFSIYIFKKLFY